MDGPISSFFFVWGWGSGNSLKLKKKFIKIFPFFKLSRMSCTIAYKLCTAFSILTFESVVDFKNLLKDIYNSLFLIQVKHDL